MSITAYHGTSKENSDKILKSGHFKKGTWFALNVKDALGYGGPIIFKVELPATGFQGEESWQFHLRNEMTMKETNAKVI